MRPSTIIYIGTANSRRNTREIVIYFTAGNDTEQNVVRRPSHYCDKLITSQGVRNSEDKFSGGYESALPDTSARGGVYPQSL